MTIQISIKNEDKSREIELIEVSINKETGQRKEGAPYRLAPGCSTSSYVYLLRDILVREVNPG